MGLKIENTHVDGWEAAIRGMRNPMNSWDRSDSGWEICEEDGELVYVVGDNDLELMKKLANGGSVHAKYRRMINVTVDITAPLYWWKEYDTYKVGTVRNSCSTMHKIQEKEFTLDDFSCEHLYLKKSDSVRTFSLETENNQQIFCNSVDILKATIELLNAYRTDYLETKDKKDWWQMIQLLPSSYNQRATVQLSYEVLANIYKWRKEHKLDEWCWFCQWIEGLPHSEIITCAVSSKTDRLEGGVFMPK